MSARADVGLTRTRTLLNGFVWRAQPCKITQRRWITRASC
jgi:hypothetical protein